MWHYEWYQNEIFLSHDIVKSYSPGVYIYVNPNKDYAKIFLSPFLLEGIQYDLKHKSSNFGLILTRTTQTYTLEVYAELFLPEIVRTGYTFGKVV